MAVNPVTDEERAEIVEALRGGTNRNDAARQFDRSPGTISKIAKETGIRFDRSQTKAATEAKQADNRARRAELASRFIDTAHALLDALDQPYRAFKIGGKDNVYTEQILDKPTDTAIRNFMVAVGIAVQKSLDIERIDQPEAGHGQIDALVGAIQKAREKRSS